MSTRTSGPVPTRPPVSGGHVIVIGAGATGALTAVNLVEAGFKVTLIEKVKPGNGSSQRSAAAIRAQFGTPETALGMAYSEAWYQNIHDHLRTPVDQREVVLQPNGYLWIYEDPDLVPLWNSRVRTARQEVWANACQAAEMQRQIGLPVETLSADEVWSRWPHLNGESAGGLIGATWCPTDGFLKPDLVYNLGVRRARELGAQVFLDTEVIGSQIIAGRIVGLIVRQGTEQMVIGCDAVVNCTNAWAPRVSQIIGGMELPISPRKRYLGFVESKDEDTNWEHLPFTIYGDGCCYSRPEGKKQMMMGCAHETPPDLEFTDEDQDAIEDGFGHDYRSCQSYVAWMRERIEGFAPEIVKGEASATTCGYYGDTPDHNPLIGVDGKLDGLYHCAGFSGHGLMHAPISALLIQAILTGQVTEHEQRKGVSIPGQDQLLYLDRFTPDRSFDGPSEGHVL